MKKFYKAMEAFAENERTESQICVNQYFDNNDNIKVVIENWFDKNNGETTRVIYYTDGTYETHKL